MSDNPNPKHGGLVPSGDRGLTTRSSALVRRGLEALTSRQACIVRFPPDRSMGKFYICERGTNALVARALLIFGNEILADALGNVTVPPRKEMCLKISNEVSADLSPLTSLKPDDLRMLDLGWTQIDDAGLVYLRALTGLQNLILGGTKISDGGLAHLQALTELRSLDLSSTQVTDAGLVHLRTLTKLEWLDLKGARVSETGVNDLQGALPNCDIEK